MRASKIEERFADFVDGPSADVFRSLRQLVLPRARTLIAASFWSDVRALFADRQYDAVLKLCEQHESAACLSPRFHWYCGVSAAECGDFERADFERAAMQSLLQVLLELGQGTEESPYLVTYIGDAYDILEALAIRPLGQQVVETAERRCDVIFAEDGEHYWFDVSDILPAGPLPVIQNKTSQVARKPIQAVRNN